MRQGKRTKVSLLTCILLLSTCICLFNIEIANCDFTSIDRQQSFRHDSTHSGYSISTTPTTKQTLCSYTTGSYVGASPAVAKDIAFVGSDGGDVHIFGMRAVTYMAGTYYTVAFVESGLAAGTSWSVTFNGVPQTSTSDLITFSAPNGVYAYSVGVPSGYTSSSALSGTLTVDDGNVVKNIAFTPIPPPSYTLTMLVVGEGTVSPGNGIYVQGTTVPLEAIGAEGWSFSEWSGDASGTGNTTIIMDSSKTVTATFTQNEYTLTMLVAGEGTVSPSNGTHLSGATVSLEAIPSEGWGFSEWSGDASGTGNTILVMDGNKTVTATFTQNVSIPEFPSALLLSVFLIVLSAIVAAVRKDR